MLQETVDIIIVGGYLSLILIIGLWCSKDIQGFKQYATASGGVGPLIIFATMSASFIGGGFSNGNAEKVFIFGIANIVCIWGFSLKEIIQARYIAPRMKYFPNAISVGDILAPAYGKIGRIVGGLGGILLCCGIVGAQVGAIGIVFNVLFGLDRIVGIAIGCSIVILYTTMGGMRAVIYTDIAQFIMLAIGMPLTLIFGVYYAGGIEAIYHSVPVDHLTLPGPEFGWFGLIGLILVFMVGETLIPPLIQRLLAARTPEDAAKGSLYSGLFSIFFFAITGLIGLVALTIDPTIAPENAMAFVVTTALPTVVKGLVVAGMISIVMSSADSYLNAASTTFVNDVLKPIWTRPISDINLLFIAKTVTLVIGITSVLFAIAIESVLDILLYAYNFWAPMVLAPLVAAIFGLKRGPLAFLTGAIAGICATTIWSTVLGDPGSFPGSVVGLFVNLTVFSLTPKTRVAGAEPAVEPAE
ncbi:solute:Na+ symporter, SSS family protein [Pseudovibrio japonicus]|uniref:Solute:Na+ symporter, SSS family protein n=1 Tax=Pseudovibrio japonicus TaxID=366534 RepID=A0ABQ3EHZ7_9HYPH|nr:sodium:solute symporter family protein [Pseudovibrio japonicus]GHB40333.1 solute:Na+ symporter, SSS family protein [Pseudovibrio japonicus]